MFFKDEWVDVSRTDVAVVQARLVFFFPLARLRGAVLAPVGENAAADAALLAVGNYGLGHDAPPEYKERDTDRSGCALQIGRITQKIITPAVRAISRF
jgi:hypothetical protein